MLPIRVVLAENYSDWEIAVLAGTGRAFFGADIGLDRPQALRDGRIITAPAPAPASFAMEVLGAAGLEPQAASAIIDMLAKEHAMRAGS